MTDLRAAAQALFNDCLASDFNEHWDSYKALEAALAADAEQCEWTRDMELGCYETDCGEAANSAGAATLCFNCGKKIKFKESDDE